MKKKWFRPSNILNAVFIIYLLAMIFIPEVKGWTIQRMMSIGLFQPDVSHANPPAPAGVAKEVRFQDYNGMVLDLSEQKGKVVFINFWATWCPPCIAEMPAIQQLYDQFRSDSRVVFIMADMDNDPAKAKAFLNKKGLDLPLYAPASQLPPSLYTGTLPTTVILDKSGNVTFHHEGAADYSNPEVAEFIRKLLQQPGGH